MTDKPINARRFYAFMNEREAIRLRKEAGEPWPWTQDPILQKYSFTNVKRLHDRTTQWLLKNRYTPNADRPGGEIIFNAALYRYFGTIEWAEAVGWVRRWDPSKVAALARARLDAGERVFTGAYLVTNAGHKGPKEEVLCHKFLTPVWKAREYLTMRTTETGLWRVLVEELRNFEGFGGTGFMAKEAVQDVMLTPLLANCTDRYTWSPCGPGARRGLNWAYGRSPEKNIPEQQCVEEMHELLLLHKRHAVGLPMLEMHDIQFQLCEVWKYMKVELGLGRPRKMYKPEKGN